jgi:Pentapeptide repeats (8 copies)
VRVCLKRLDACVSRATTSVARCGIAKAIVFAGQLGIVFALISYVYSCRERKQAKEYQAWQLIVLSHMKSGDAGRKDALEALNADGVSMYGVDVCCNAYLDGIRLVNGRLNRAVFRLARLDNGDFRRADLRDADFEGARIDGGNFEGADLTGAMLKGAWLRGADLRHAKLDRIKAQFADLSDANLEEAIFSRARLRKTDLRHARLAKVTGWESLGDMTLANVYGIIDAPDGFLELAHRKGAVEIEDSEQWQALKDQVTP